MGMVSDLAKGFGAHVTGVRFVFSGKGWLAPLLAPFLLTVVLFVAGFAAFAAWADDLLAWLWTMDPADAGGFAAVMYWLYRYVLKYLLYLLLLALSYFLFMVAANILASPIYDRLAARLAVRDAGAAPTEIGLLGVIAAECKKAAFVLALPLACLFIPVVGQILAPFLAMIFLAWDFVDFSLSRERPGFRERLAYVWKRKFLLLGFGAVLFIPLVNIVFYPFAIVGASLLYREDVRAQRANGGGT